MRRAAVTVLLGAALLLVSAAPSEAATCAGSIRGATGSYYFQVVTIRGVTCARAREVARAYDRTGMAPGAWECFLARQSDAPRLFSCGAGGSSGDVRTWPHAFEARRVRPRTRITRLSMRVTPTRVFVRVRVCGRRGRVRLRFTETASPPGRDRPVFARTRRGRIRRQTSRCQTHRFNWRFADKFAGVARYRLAVRAKTTGRSWSRVASRRRDTFD